MSTPEDPLFSKEGTRHRFKRGAMVGAVVGTSSLLLTLGSYVLQDPNVILDLKDLVVEYPQVLGVMIGGIGATSLVGGAVNNFINGFRPTARLFQRNIPEETNREKPPFSLNLAAFNSLVLGNTIWVGFKGNDLIHDLHHAEAYNDFTKTLLNINSYIVDNPAPVISAITLGWILRSVARNRQNQRRNQ